MAANKKPLQVGTMVLPSRRGEPAQFIPATAAGEASGPKIVPMPPPLHEAPAEPAGLAAVLEADERRRVGLAVAKAAGGGTLSGTERALIAKADAAARLAERAKSGNWDPGVVAEALGVYWLNGDGGKYYLNENGRWLHVGRDSLLLRMERMGVPAWLMNDEKITRQAQVLLHIERDRHVDAAVVGLAGWSSGPAVVHDSRILIMKGPRLIEPQNVEWDMLREFIETRLVREVALPANPTKEQVQKNARDAAVQINLLHGWMQRAVENVYFAGDEVLPGQLLAIAGGAGSGKSRIQNWIITPLLGGRDADPQEWIYGGDKFNADCVAAEHLKMEDPKTDSKMSDRTEAARRLKMLVANDDTRLRKMYADAIKVDPKWRVTQSFNDQPDAIRFFPPLSPDFADKVIFLRANAAPMPMPVGTLTERAAFRKTLRDQLPGYLWHLINEFRLPDYLRGERFGVVQYCDPDIRALLIEDSPAVELLAIIDATELTVDRLSGTDKRGSIWKSENGMTGEEALRTYGMQPGTQARRIVDGAIAAGVRVWIGGFEDMERQLQHESANHRDAARKRIGPSSVPRMLGVIERDVAPERMCRYNASGGLKRLWILAEPFVD